MKSRKNLLIIMGLVITIVVFGISYAFFSYQRVGETSEVIAGQIYLNYIDGDEVSLINAFPETKSEALLREDNIFTFQIKGKNTSNTDLHYKINLNYGDAISGKTRIDDEDIKVYLERDGETVIDGVSFNSLNNRTILVETIEAGTTEEKTINYTLRIWVSEDVVISDTAAYANYLTDTWKDSYASVRINVIGQAGGNTFVKPLINEIETKYTDVLTEADAFGNRYISGTKEGITNNYVKFSGLTWRIVGVNADGTIKLITESSVDYRPWDSTGNTDYATSEIREWLNNDFLETINEDVIATSTFNYTDFSMSFEVGEIKMLQDKVGLLSAFDYLGVSAIDLSTGNFGYMENNYLMNGQEWYMSTKIEEGIVWTGSPKVYLESNLGVNVSVGGIGVISSSGIRPVINVLSTIKFVEGNGTKENPYVIKGDESSGNYDYNDDFETKLSNLSEADINGNRYVTGLVEDNYVWYSGKLWRVVALNGDGTVKLVTQNAITSISWDINNSNNYANSQVRKWLNEEFLKTLYNNGELLETSEWDYVYGKISDKVGLLTLDEYNEGGGSIYTNYTNTYLKTGYRWWLMTPYTIDNDASRVWYAVDNGVASWSDAANAYGVRPSVNLKSGIQIEGGTGIASDPYIIKGDKATGTASELLNNRLSGEYVKFNGVKYRIVGTETINNHRLTKITMADYDVNSNTIDTSESFGNSGVFTDTTGIGLYLKNWYEGSSVDGTSKSMIATKEDGVKWYQGTDTGIDYTKSKTGEGISATIGLPYYGEMFSTQFGKGSDYSIYTWFMTRYNQTSWFLCSADVDGDALWRDAAGARGVRPSMYLKSNVRLGDTDGDGSVGDGTINHPYELVIN